MAIEGHKITAQSLSSFNQSIILGHIKPFLTHGTKRKTNHYLRADLGEYAKINGYVKTIKPQPQTRNRGLFVYSSFLICGLKP
ncbi:hypothetical protein AWH48_16525 [Domibacillus aminovorans]|uniref:Uncharacterized protein n=1 Tax=Domibacillus aminovorans TaxID=29332 RepID=A0A177KYW9_9BACI|nr:hypothetical protein [Domibacillus aminovorans]OAH58609.1 hypothetical protein AWH48_16525 [Domibacillus aminovorans]